MPAILSFDSAAHYAWSRRPITLLTVTHENTNVLKTITIYWKLPQFLSIYQA
jgi:hypothetical protein